MPGTQEHPARSGWGDESPKDKTPDEPASKRQKTGAVHSTAAASRRLDPTVAKDILAFLDVHKVSDAMSVGSLVNAFDETRQPLEVLQLQEKVRVGVLKVLLKVSAKDHLNTATASNDASRQHFVTSQGPPAGAQSSKTNIVQPSRKRKHEPSSQAKNSKAQSTAASSTAQGEMPNATRKHAATQAIKISPAMPKTNSSKKNAGKKGQAAVSITQDSGSRKRKCPGTDDEEALPIDTFKQDIGKDGIAPVPSKSIKRAKLGHLGDVTGSRSNQLPRVVDEPKQPRAKEPANRYKLTSKSKPEASAAVQSVVPKTPSLQSQSVTDKARKPKRKATEDGYRPARKPKLDFGGNSSTLRSNPSEPRAFEKPVKPKAKEPENRFRLTHAPKPAAGLYVRPANNTPPLRESKRSVPGANGTEAEESEGRRKRQKTGSRTATCPDVLGSAKEHETPQPKYIRKPDMTDFLRSNGVFRQYGVERPSLEEELAEQDRLTADRKKCERQERRKT